MVVKGEILQFPLCDNHNDDLMGSAQKRDSAGVAPRGKRWIRTYP